MHASFTQTYWGDQMDPHASITNHCQISLGIPSGTSDFNRAVCDNRTINIALQRVGVLQGTLNARQVFLKLKCIMDDPIIPLPYRCTLDPPDHINVFTDGSWQFPLRHYFALGGAGVW